MAQQRPGTELYIPPTSGHYVIQLAGSEMARIIRCFPDHVEAQQFADNINRHGGNTTIVSR